MTLSRRVLLSSFALALGLRSGRSSANDLPVFRDTAARRAAAWLGRRCAPWPNIGLAADAQQLRAAIRADFDAGRTCVVDGWLLSETEAALYVRAAGLTPETPDV